MSKLWVERTPENFVFDVKAFRLFTQHHTMPKVMPKYVAESLPVDKKTYLRDIRQVGVQRGADGKNRKGLGLKPGWMAGRKCFCEINDRELLTGFLFS